MSVLLPRLPGPSAESMLDRLWDGDAMHWPGFDPTDLPDEARFASSGGSAAAGARPLREIRDGILFLTS